MKKAYFSISILIAATLAIASILHKPSLKNDKLVTAQAVKTVRELKKMIGQEFDSQTEHLMSRRFPVGSSSIALFTITSDKESIDFAKKKLIIQKTIKWPGVEIGLSESNVILYASLDESEPIETSGSARISLVGVGGIGGVVLLAILSLWGTRGR